MYGNNTYSLGLPHYNIYTNKLYSCANLANPDFLFTITPYSYAKLKFICEVKGFDPDAYKIEANLGLVVVIGISCGIPILIWTFLTSYKCVFGKRFRLYKTQIELEDELRPKPVRLTEEQIKDLVRMRVIQAVCAHNMHEPEVQMWEEFMDNDHEIDPDIIP